jgi:hypothetical protein
MKRSILFSILLALSMGLAQAAPPERMNYQGVLRDAADKPLSGTYTMVFRFYNAASGGNLLLTDTHTDGAAVTVSGGLFNALLGDGALTAGAYASLGEVFANESDVYLEVQVIDETLTPRIRVASAGYALNSARLDGRPAGGFIDTSAVTQTKAGDLALGDLTVAGNDIFFDGGSKIVSTPGNLQLRNNGPTDDIVLIAGSSWHNGRLTMYGSGKWELRAANGIFEFMQGSSNDPIARLTADGSLSLGGELSAGNVPLAMPSGPLNLYVNASTGDDDNDGLTPATAKQTIQAAVNVVPVVSTGPATIHIADGTYHESVFIERRFFWPGSAWPQITLLGNEASPQSVVLDGQGTLSEGVLVLGIAAIRGIEVTNYTEEGFEVDFGYMIVDNCRVINNVNRPDPHWNGGIAIYTAGASISNTVIANNGYHGIEIEGGWFNVEVADLEITGNGGDGLYLNSSGSLDSDGSLVIQDNGGIGVVASDGASVDLNGRADLTIQSNTGGSMQASYHSTIRGYGSGTVGTCVATTQSICEP